MVQKVLRELLDQPVLKVQKEIQVRQVQPDPKVLRALLALRVLVVVCGFQELELLELPQPQVFLQIQELQAPM